MKRVVEVRRALGDAAATEALGTCLAGGLDAALAHRRARSALLVTLDGPLGAGKTTLVRGLVRALGGRRPVRSPTYTLVEPHSTDSVEVYHFDLYRLGAAEELELIGAREYFGADALCVVEWPQRGAGWLPAADLAVELDYAGDAREARLHPLSDAGDRLLASAVT